MRTMVVFVIIIAFISIDGYFAAKTSKEGIDVIRYPGPVKEMNDVDDDTEPPECKGKTFCTIKPSGYPEEKYNKIFQNHTKPLVNLPSLVEDPSVDNRVANPDEADNCGVAVTYEQLYQIRDNKKAPWMNVVQAPEVGYTQKVRMETCLLPGDPCFKIFSGPPQYETLCKQKYFTWEVLVEDKDNKFKTHKVELPSCCSCAYRTSMQFLKSTRPFN